MSDMNIATLMRYTGNKECEPYFNNQYYIMHDYRIMAEKLDFSFAVILNGCDFERVCAKCDGLIIPGSGMSINPKYYGGEDKPPKIDEYTLDSALIKYFYEHGKPIFGICGGHQELNIFFGGAIKLVDDLDNHQVLSRHEADVEKGSFVHDVFGTDKADVNCYHAWEICNIPDCLKVVSRTPDGVAEAIEWKEKNIFATQWHPERSFHDERDSVVEQKFFENFLQRCREVK